LYQFKFVPYDKTAINCNTGTIYDKTTTTTTTTTTTIIIIIIINCNWKNSCPLLRHYDVEAYRRGELKLHTFLNMTLHRNE